MGSRALDRSTSANDQTQRARHNALLSVCRLRATPPCGCGRPVYFGHGSEAATPAFTISAPPAAGLHRRRSRLAHAYEGADHEALRRRLGDLSSFSLSAPRAQVDPREDGVLCFGRVAFDVVHQFRPGSRSLPQGHPHHAGGATVPRSAAANVWGRQNPLDEQPLVARRRRPVPWRRALSVLRDGLASGGRGAGRIAGGDRAHGKCCWSGLAGLRCFTSDVHRCRQRPKYLEANRHRAFVA